MHSRYLPILALLSPLSLANPIARVHLLPRQFTNTSSTGITQTSTGTTAIAAVLTTATCTATYTAAPDARCSDVASRNSIQLSSFEANSAANSTDCQDILLGYALCLSNDEIVEATSSTAPFLNTTLPGTPGTPGTTGSVVLNTAASNTAASNTAAHNTAATGTGTGVGTGTAASAATLVQASSSPAVTSFMYIIEEKVSETTLTSFDTSTLTYTIGTGTSKAVRTTQVTHTNEEIRTLTALSTISTITALADVTETVSPISNAETSMTSSSTLLVESTASSTSSETSMSSTVQVEATTSNTSSESSTSSESVEASISSALSSSIPAKAITTSSSTSSSELLTSSSSSVLTSSSELLTSSSALANSVATSSPVATSSSPTPTPTASSSVDVYKAYTGNGSVSAGWPSEDQWVTFDHMFTANTPHIQESCDAWGVARNSDAETAELKDAILSSANSTGVDARFILATVMQESTGCVRVITTQYSHLNPGMMQSHNGTGTCNTNQAALGVPGTGALASNVQDPCPASEIRQQITDGTAGTSSGDGLQQILAQQTQTDASRYYRTARIYNGGSVDPSGDLGKGCCTLCYASDIANRLTGWVTAKSTCSL